MTDITGDFRRPFAEQIAAFRLRLQNLVGTVKWDDISHAQHDRAFMVAGAMKADLLADLAEAVDKAVSQGTSLQEFRRDFRGIVETRGWHGWTGEETKRGQAWRTRVIYKTNMATSYAAGRMAQLVEGGFSLWVYRHGNSMEPRLQHLGWDGLILAPDHPFWLQHAPPNGWGCSCYVAGARSVAGAVRLGGKPGMTLPDGWDAINPKTGAQVGIDKGWGYAPGASVVDDIIAAVKEKSNLLPPLLAKELDKAVTQISERPDEEDVAEFLADVLDWDVRMTDYARRLYDAADMKEITFPEALVIHAYTGSFSTMINEAARAVAINEPVSAQAARLVQIRQGALQRLKPAPGITVRGVPEPSSRLLAFFQDAKAGTRFEFNGFSSSSRDPDKAFAGPLRFIIQGRSGRDVGRLSLHSGEQEVLLSSGLQFTILSKTERDGVLTIWIEEVRPHAYVVLTEEARHAAELG